ncbi:MAG: glycine cleavage T C-terminal barrel domain-containing protein [Pseudomonadales bacterium]
MVHGAADISMREFDPRRFGDYANKNWQVINAKEDYCLRHEIPFPHFNRQAGRPVKPSPLYDRLQEKGAVFEEVYGHERPRWFARNGVAQQDHYSFRRNIVHDIVGQEVMAVRQRVGVMDISAFTKVEVCGPDAAAFLDRLVPNRLPQKEGRVALTHLLNRRGRIEIELTLARLAADRFYLACAAFFEQRLLDHLNYYRDGERFEINNLSNTWAAITLQGPKSRDVLGANTSASLDYANFCWLSAHEIDIAGKKMWALRMSYAGELGWEIHGPREDMLVVYDALWVSGERHGIADYGFFAMNAMRMEKAFPGASELTNEVTLPEANVLRFVKIDKGEFVGRSATQQSLANPLPWVCAYLAIEPDGDTDGHGGEAVLLGGRRVGVTSSIAYGHSVRCILAFAYIKPEAAKPGIELDVIIMGKPRKARVCSEPMYDPQSLLPRTDT